MRSKRRLYLHWLRLTATLGCAVGLSLPGCQFPDYDLPDANGGSGGGGASGGAGTSGSGMVAGNGAVAGEAGDAGMAGQPPAPSLCDTVADCVPRSRQGWDGPIAFWRGNVPEGTQPECPEGYTSPMDLYLGLTVTTTGCDCTCAAHEQTCEATLSVYNDKGCSSVCATVPATSSCVAFAGCSGNEGGMRSEKPLPKGGSCQPDVGDPDSLKWQTFARICVPRSKEPGLCEESGQACAPTPGTPYLTDACVVRVFGEGSKELDCPDEYPKSYGTYYEGAIDNRSCSDCTCGALTGGDCEGLATLTNDSRCVTGQTYVLGEPSCTGFALTEPPTHLSVQYTLKPGSCSVETPSRVIGDATLSANRYKICCL